MWTRLLVQCAIVLACVVIFSLNAVAYAAQVNPAWRQEWEKTLETARKEGQVNVYISGYEAVLTDFEKEYPDIKLVAVTGRGNQLGQRLLSERRAEKYLADVVSAGANPNYQQFYPAKALDPIKPALILSEVTDQTKWYLKRHQYSDPEGQYVFNYVGSATYGAVNYNTKLVDVKEFKSYWISSILSGRARSRRGTSARQGPAPAIPDSFTTILSLACRLFENFLARWT